MHARHIVTAFTLVTVGFLLNGDSATVLCGEQDDALTRFKAEAIGQWHAYERLLSSVQGSWKSQSTCFQGGVASAGQRVDAHYKQRPGAALLIFDQVDSDRRYRRVFLFNPEYAAVLSAKSEAAPWVLTDLELSSHPDFASSPVFDKIQRPPYVEIAALVSLGRHRLSSLFESGVFKPVAAHFDNHEGRRCIKVTFELARAPHQDEYPADGIQSGYLLLDPDAFWIILRAQYSRTSLCGRGEGKVFYVFEQDTAKLPLPVHVKREEHWTLDDGQVWSSKCDTHFNLVLSPVPPDMTEFTLSAFGLPEPPGVTWPKPTPWYLWAAVAAAVCLVLAFVLRWLARSRATQRPTSS